MQWQKFKSRVRQKNRERKSNHMSKYKFEFSLSNPSDDRELKEAIKSAEMLKKAYLR